MARYWSWRSLEFNLVQEGKGIKQFVDIRAISYSDRVESELVRGAGRGILGTTDASYLPGDMTFELFSKWYRVWTLDATNQGEIPLGDLDFRIVVSHKTRTETEAIIDEIDFQVLGPDDAPTQGAAPNVTTVQCLPTQIVRNGVIL